MSFPKNQRTEKGAFTYFGPSLSGTNYLLILGSSHLSLLSKSNLKHIFALKHTDNNFLLRYCFVSLLGSWFLLSYFLSPINLLRFLETTTYFFLVQLRSHHPVFKFCCNQILRVCDVFSGTKEIQVLLANG